jgi:exopolyphosphatase/pppGpp-phosphohydrolase
MRIGVLDVGSNTVHLLVVDAHDGAAPVPAFKHSIPLRMSEHVAEDGRIDEDAIAELCLHIRASQDAVEDMGATEFMAFATSAIREAPNGDDVVRQVRERTGVDLEVLTVTRKRGSRSSLSAVGSVGQRAASSCLTLVVARWKSRSAQMRSRKSRFPFPSALAG